MLASCLLAGLLALGVSEGPDVLEALERAQVALFDRVAPSVVFIVQPDGLGSGFVVTRDGLVVTNAHVVGKAEQVDAVLFDGRRTVGKIVEKGASLDLALVRIEVPHGGVTPLAMGEAAGLTPGRWVASVGHGLGGAWTFTVGMVSNVYPIQGRRAVFQTQIPLNVGNSGGPILDRSGRAIGVVTAGMRESNDVNFAIRLDEAINDLPLLATACDCVTITAPPAARIFVDGRLVGTGPTHTFFARPGPYEVLVVGPAGPQQRTITFPETRTVPF